MTGSAPTRWRMDVSSACAVFSPQLMQVPPVAAGSALMDASTVAALVLKL